MISKRFVWFEFDKEVEGLWQSMSVSGKRFAYHQRLSTLIGQTPNFKTDLDSLKVLDVFLSAVKSDLANKHISEGRVLAHDEFARLIIVLLYHVVRVIEYELAQQTPKSTVSIYVAQGFGRIYTRLFSQMGTSHVNQVLNNDELEAFYCGVGVLCQSVNAQGQPVADRIFILPVIGARLFGSIDRVFMEGLNSDGESQGVAEDSLYWAVHDFVAKFRTLQQGVNGNDSAKALFDEQSLVFTEKTQTTHLRTSDEVNATITQGQPEEHDVPSHNAWPNTTDKMETAHSLDVPHLANQTISAVTNSESLSKPSPPSAYKQRARASHTPKLFDEVYHDLLHINTASDAVNHYQKANMVLNKFDQFIDAKLAEGRNQDEIVFNDSQTNARKQALALLVGLVKQGNPSAMLRLALCYFSGRGVGKDVQKAVVLTERAAKMGDIRAQKLLSRLYYQGFSPDEGGMMIDVAMGEYWLRKAAEGGHPEAKKVCAYMNQVEILKSDQHAEAVSDKRYGMLFFALGIGTVLLFILLSVV